MLFLTAHALALVGPALRGPRQHLLLGPQPPHHLRVIQSITGLAAETQGGSTATAEQAAEMELLAGMLEQQNRCETLTTAPSLIDGEWDQVYTDNPIGITFGNGKLMRRKLLGPFRGRVTQLVDTSAASAQYRQRIQTWAGLLRGELKVDVSVAGPFEFLHASRAPPRRLVVAESGAHWMVRDMGVLTRDGARSVEIVGS